MGIADWAFWVSGAVWQYAVVCLPKQDLPINVSLFAWQ